MTNREYITASLAGLGVSADDVEIILLKAGLDGDADAVAKDCDMAIYNRFSVVLKGFGQNVTEGDYSLSWNIDAAKLFYKALCNELGVDDVLDEKPKVRNRSYMW